MMIQKLLFNTPAILFSAPKKAVRFGMSGEPTPGDQNPARELEAGDLFQKAAHEVQPIADAPDTFTRSRRERVRTPKYKEAA
jgi:hypothetical protein